MNWGDPRLPQRFWDKVHPEPNSGCWFWIGGRDRKGYGQLKWTANGGQITKAHRLTVALAEDLPSNMTVDHKCENQSCVNPHHCQVVTRADNARLHFIRHPEFSAKLVTHGGTRTLRAPCEHDRSAASAMDAHGRCRICYAHRMRDWRKARRAS